MGKWFAPLGKLVASGFVAVVLLSGCTSRDAGGGDLIGLEIEPQTLQLAKGTSAPLKATALYANGAKEDITELVGWLSANPAVATVGNAAGSSGRVSGVEVGSTQVTASYEGVEASANVEVTPAIITALAISPNPASVPKGMTVQLVATAVFSDGSTQNITADADWSSAAPAVATVGNDAASKGRLSGVELGQTTVSASFESLNASVSATVTAAQAIALEVTPSARSIAKGTTQQFTATAVLSDGSTQDVTEMAAWSSSNGTIAQVSNASGTRGRAQGLQVGSAQITASFQNRSGSASLTVTAAELSGVQISPTSPSIAKGTSRQFAAIAVFTDGSNQNVTADATWASSNPDVATISNAAGSSGLAQSKDEGTTEISFTYADRSASTTLTVTGAVVASIDVTPTNPSIAKGTQQQFAATATFTDATTQDVTTQASWSSTSPGVATVSNAADSKGLATGVNQGSASIRATYQNVTGATTLTVTAAVVTGLQVTPTDPSIAKGTTQQFTATATFSDASTQNVTNAAAWASSDPDVASVSNAAGSKGRAQGLDTGESDISASYQGFDAKSTLTVTDAVLTQVQVTPASQQIPLGRTQQYTATGVYSDGTTQDLTDAATWSSSNADVIEISNAAPNQGLAAAKAVGTATISAATDGKTGSTGVQVTSAALDAIQISPTNARLAVSFKRNYTATGIYSDGSSRDITNDVVWESSSASIATISNSAGSKGLATGVAPGVVEIRAALSGVTKSTQLTVTNATLTSLQVSPPDKTIPLGTSQQYTATAIFSDNSTQDLTTQVSWSSSNPAVATISNSAGSKGKAQSVDAGGPIVITATYEAESGTASLTVSDAALVSIAVKPPTASLPKGKTLDYEATGTYTDSTTRDITQEVTWSSSNTGVATVSNAAGSQGRATAQAVGSATITAAQGNVSGNAALTVTNAVLESITVTSDETGPLPEGRVRQFKATGRYSDNSVRAITGEVLWASSNESVATISNAQGEKGLAEAVSAGTTTITATLDGVVGNDVLNVSDAVLEALAITPANPTVPKGLQQQMTATGTFSDGSTRNVTADVTWSSLNTAVVEISNSANTEGLAFAKAQGATTIEAADPDTGIKATTGFEVSAAQLESISVSPADDAVVTPVQIPLMFGVQLKAIGAFSDGSQSPITDQVAWSTLEPGTVRIGDGTADKGYALGVAAGTTTVVAALGGKTGTATVSAVVATLNTIDVTPSQASVAATGEQSFVATGAFSNGRTYDVTRDVTWESQDETVAVVSNDEGSEGTATGRVPGETTITATSGSVSDSATLTVTLF